MQMRLAWLTHTRPDCLFEIFHLAQITEIHFQSDKKQFVKYLNEAVKYVTTDRVTIKFPKVDVHSVRVVDFFDASFANNEDMSTQLGHTCFMCDNAEKVISICFRSYKERRTSRSAMTREVFAFSDFADNEIKLSAELGTILRHSVQIQLLTDSKSLFLMISLEAQEHSK